MCKDICHNVIYTSDKLDRADVPNTKGILQEIKC